MTLFRISSSVIFTFTFLLLLCWLNVSGEEILNLDGQSFVIMKLESSSFHDTISLKFTTNSANGNLIYSRGTQGDIFSLRMQDNKIVLSLNLGNSDQINTITAGSLLDDSKEHNILITRNNRDLNLTVDDHTVKHKITGDSVRLDLNDKVSQYFTFLSQTYLGIELTLITNHLFFFPLC